MIFSEERSNYAINFIQSLKHTKGEWAGKPFDLLPWQRDIISNVYGTINERGMRQYTHAYVEVPKKNGKSELGAAIALYHTFGDGEQRGQVYSCAGDREQASLVFDVAFDMIGYSKALKARCKPNISQKKITDKLTGTVYKALSAEAYTKHGLDLSACIFDELHVQPNREFFDTMTDGAGDARREPLWYIITTAGNDADRKSLGWDIHDIAKQIIDGKVENPHWYCKIFGIEPDFEGDIFDEKLWYAVNPSLGTTIDIEAFRRAAIEAKTSDSKERNFRWLRLNQWVATKKIGWLPITLWDSTERDWDPDDLIGERCYVGLDLSSTTDLTAAAPLFPPTANRPDWRHLNLCWVPEENMRERETKDKVPYEKWAKDGYLTATPGNVVDYGQVAAALEAINKLYNVIHFFCDPWRLEYLKQLLPAEIQSKFVEIPQSMAGMSCGMEEIGRMMMAGELTHIKDPVGRWSFGNVRVAVDGNNNTKPMKNKSIERIDPTVALINAMSGAIKMEPKRSVYESRGLRTMG